MASAITQDRIDSMEYVPNAALREYAERYVGATSSEWSEVAYVAGILRKYKDRFIGDGSTLRRYLGFRCETERAPTPYIRYDMAVRIARAIGAAPVDVGI